MFGLCLCLWPLHGIRFHSPVHLFSFWSPFFYRYYYCPVAVVLFRLSLYLMMFINKLLQGIQLTLVFLNHMRSLADTLCSIYISLFYSLFTLAISALTLSRFRSEAITLNSLDVVRLSFFIFSLHPSICNTFYLFDIQPIHAGLLL